MSATVGTTKIEKIKRALCSLSCPHPGQASQISLPIWILKDQLLQIYVLYDGDIYCKVKSGADFWFLKNLFLKWFIFRLLQWIAKRWIPTLFWDHSDLNDLNICNPRSANTYSRPRCIPWYLKIFWRWTLLFWVLAASFTTVAFVGTEELFVRLQLWTHLQERRTLNWCLGNLSFARFRTMQK